MASASQSQANMTIIDDGMQEVPITADACSFDHRQALKLKDIEKRYEDQLKRRKKQWEKQLERMRGDFLQLFPVGQAHTSNDVDHPHQQPSGSGSGSGLSAKAHSSNESLVIKRKGSTDVLDPKKLRALMTEYPHEGRRFRLRFDLGGFDPKSVVVTVDHDRIIVRASRVVTVDDSTADEQQRLQQNPDTTTSTTAITTASTPTLARNGNGEQHHHLHLQPPPRSKKHIINQEQQQQLQSEAEHPEKRHPQQQQQDHAYQQEYVRKIERPAEVDPKRVRAFLSSDGVLTLEAQLPPQTLSLAGQHGAKSSPSHGGPVSLLHDSPSNSLAGRKSRSGSSDSPKTPSAAAPMKIGVPSFHERDGMRVLSLTIDLGATYKASEVMVQVVKENKLLVKARHEERTTERMVKSKFCREYELSEKIETYSVRAGLAEDNHLIVGALAKVHPVVPVAGGATGDKDKDKNKKKVPPTTTDRKMSKSSTTDNHENSCSSSGLADQPSSRSDLAKDLLHPSFDEEKRKCKLKRLVQSPNSYFMDVKCPGCFKITTVFSHAQTVVVCAGCSTVLCQPTGGKARLTEGCSFRRKQH